MRFMETLVKNTTDTSNRCYPMKNRLPDVLPFDASRVELPTTKDDYINASHVRDLSRHCPRFIATQAPAPNTFSDFWTMVWQEQVMTNGTQTRDLGLQHPISRNLTKIIKTNEIHWNQWIF